MNSTDQYYRVVSPITVTTFSSIISLEKILKSGTVFKPVLEVFSQELPFITKGLLIETNQESLICELDFDAEDITIKAQPISKQEYEATPLLFPLSDLDPFNLLSSQE